MVHLLITVIYLSFISLGLPDALLGSAWPVMYGQLGVDVSAAGIVTMLISFCTILSSLASDRLTFKLGTGKVTMLSVAMTAVALFGFSSCTSLWQLCLWAVPYGLGAGSVDAALNNYVALHYSSRHMSWLHCMWGVGATIGPYVMGFVLSGGQPWNNGYRIVGSIQLLMAAGIVLSLPLWKQRRNAGENTAAKPKTMGQILRIPGAVEILVAFFCYCALEQTAGIWASSYLVLHKGVPAETAAFFASLFYIGITVGRAVNGFLTIRFSDTQLIRMGIVIIGLGIAAMLLPMGEQVSLLGLVLVGLGCAPVYPCIIHSTPVHFGAENSQALIGVQMASAYVGNLLMPPLYGVLAEGISEGLLPIFLLGILSLMLLMHERVVKKCGH